MPFISLPLRYCEHSEARVRLSDCTISQKISPKKTKQIKNDELLDCKIMCMRSTREMNAHKHENGEMWMCAKENVKIFPKLKIFLSFSSVFHVNFNVRNIIYGTHIHFSLLNAQATKLKNIIHATILSVFFVHSFVFSLPLCFCREKEWKNANRMRYVEYNERVTEETERNGKKKAHLDKLKAKEETL